MNIIKRFLNIITLFAVFMISAGVYGYVVEPHKGSEAFAIGGVFLGLVLIINYILFQNISVWNKVRKNN
jgi:hypothetical protein